MGNRLLFYRCPDKGQAEEAAMPTSEEQRVLLLLAKEWIHSGPPGIMDISDIVAALDQSPQRDLASAKDAVSMRPGRYEYA